MMTFIVADGSMEQTRMLFRLLTQSFIINAR